MASKLNLNAYQGATFSEVVRYESDTLYYATITAIPSTTPLVVTSTAHGMPVGWRCKFSSVGGMVELNTTAYKIVTAVTANTATFNAINPTGYRAYTSGGIITYNTPVSLSGLTARMRIRASASDQTILDELTTENGGITLDDTNKAITLLISATDTAAYTFTSSVYSLELINGSTITPIIYGTFTVDSDLNC